MKELSDRLMEEQQTPHDVAKVSRADLTEFRAIICANCPALYRDDLEDVAFVDVDDCPQVAHV